MKEFILFGISRKEKYIILNDPLQRGLMSSFFPLKEFSLKKWADKKKCGVVLTDVTESRGLLIGIRGPGFNQWMDEVEFLIPKIQNSDLSVYTFENKVLIKINQPFVQWKTSDVRVYAILTKLGVPLKVFQKSLKEWKSQPERGESPECMETTIGRISISHQYITFIVIEPKKYAVTWQRVNKFFPKEEHDVIKVHTNK